jgi:hypothetical protein
LIGTGKHADGCFVHAQGFWQVLQIVWNTCAECQKSICVVSSSVTDRSVIYWYEWCLLIIHMTLYQLMKL